MIKEGKLSNKCPTCGRPTHKGSKYCIFHAKPEEKEEEEFKRALKKYVYKIIKERLEYDFKDFIFLGDINFIVEFNLAKFKNAIFEGVTFKGDVKFEKSIFEGITYFAKATFEGYADFGEATFEGYTNFCETTFKDFAQFREAKFKDNAIFEDAIFKEKSYFYGATFKNVNFRKVSFKNNAEFGSTNIIGYADYKDSYFEQNVNFGGGFSIYKYLIFNNAFFCPGKTLSIKIYKGHSLF